MGAEPEIRLVGVSKRFGAGAAPALKRLSADIQTGCVTGLVGPDGAGKTTLLRLMAGLLLPTEGRVMVAGYDTLEETAEIRKLVGYMPQTFGLYEDLTVMENLNLYADLRGVAGEKRRAAFDRLLAFTSLDPFTKRLAAKLSGGMKQKLGLACCLIQRPRALLLDEPSVGVDPLSRRELWRMVYQLVDEGITVVWSTAYLDEAERCADVLVLNEGTLLFHGPPKELTRGMEGRIFLVSLPHTRRRQFAAKWLRDPQVLDSVIHGQKVRLVTRSRGSAGAPFDSEFTVEPGSPRFEDAFISLLGGMPKERVRDSTMPSARPVRWERGEDGVVAEARALSKRFGAFTAVDHVSFEVRRGEVFGLLGPNGAGKSTTFKMMCGLLRPTSGEARVAGIDLLEVPAQARERMGYMAQKFSLYRDLSVRQNLQFFGGVYGLKGHELTQAVERMLREFQLEPFAGANAADLPLGFKQRLSMACATMHQPPILFLDEPTSGVDPITRREFWLRINSLVELGVAVIVTTHFLDEAEYCDHLALMYEGRIIAADTPDGIKQSVQSKSLPDPMLEDAFIELIKRSRAADADETKTSLEKRRP